MSNYKIFQRITAVLCAMVITFTNVTAYAETYNVKPSASAIDTSFSTKGKLVDSTKLTIYNNPWWYSRSYTKTNGTTDFSFDKLKTSYSSKMVYHTLSLTMSGINFSATIGDSSNVSCSIANNKATYSTDDAYLSYNCTIYARCWTGSYMQESTVKYKIMSGSTSKGTVILTTTIDW